MIVTRTVGMLIVLGMHGACATSKKDGTSAIRDGGTTEEEFVEEPGQFESTDRVRVTATLSNSILTSRRVDTAEAQKIVAQLERKVQSSGRKVPKSVLEDLLSAQVLAGEDINRIRQTANMLVDLEMRRGVDKDLGAAVKLEIAVAAVRAKRFALAEYFLEELGDGDGGLGSAVKNVRGLIAMEDGRVPEAAKLFSEAVGKDVGGEAAALNLGFLSLKYGDFRTAKKSLGQAKQDWFVKSGLLIGERFEEDGKGAQSLCDSVLGDKKDHKPTLYNCALYAYQNKRDIAAAKEYLARMNRARGDASRDYQAGQLLVKMESGSGGADGDQPLKRQDGASP